MRIPLLLLLALSLVTPGLAQKPNILWITIEDTSPQFIGVYGNKDARTPTIDSLAKEGVRFTNAFSTGSVCSPSRTTLITGVRTFENGTGNHRSNIPVPAYMKGFPAYLAEKGYYTTNNSKTDYNVASPKEFIKKAWAESSNSAGWWNRKPGQPFFAVFNYNDSHQSRTMTFPYAEYKALVLDSLKAEDIIGDQAFQMPPIYRDTPEMRKQFARVYNSLKFTDNKVKHLLGQLQKDRLTDSTIIFFFSDHGEGIPRGKTNGVDLGYRVAFTVWFPPMDRHLSPWGTKAVTNEVINFEDLAPTLVSLAGGEVPPHMKGRVLMGPKRSKPVTYVELSSDRADNGIDVIRSLTDGRFMYSRNYMPFMPETRYINYMEVSDIKKLMRKDYAAGHLNETQKTIMEPRAPEVLFDTQTDPWETKNLAKDPKYKPQLEQMRRELDKRILAAKDIMFLPEYELLLISKAATPYEYRQNAANYPIADIYAAASLSGFTGKATAEKQVKLLTSPNKIVRYWAALGLRSQPASVLTPYKTQLLNAAKDAYAPVALTASVVAYETFADKQAQTDLMAFAQSDNTELSLLTVNHLLYVKNKEPFTETIQALLKKPNKGGNINGACKDFLSSLGMDKNEFLKADQN
ncbi:MAG: sulfatase [Rufibacter sp.]